MGIEFYEDGVGNVIESRKNRKTNNPGDLYRLVQMSRNAIWYE